VQINDAERLKGLNAEARDLRIIRANLRPLDRWENDRLREIRAEVQQILVGRETDVE